MLAYVARYDNEDWCTLVHGETRGKAKSRFKDCDPSRSYDYSMWVEIRISRVPGLDDKPFTFVNAVAAGFHYLDDWDGEQLPPDEFENDCNCEICRPG